MNPPVTPAASPQPTPPTGMTVQKTITVEVYGAAGKAPMYFVSDGANYNQYEGSEVGVQNDIRNLLHPPAPTVA